MQSYRDDTKSARLSSAHEYQLATESGISHEVIAERGVHSINRSRELPSVFSSRQKRRAPGILFTVHRPNGETSYSFRPNEPDPENPGHRYEQPPKSRGGPGNVLDVHPSCRHLIGRKDVPVIFVEGIKKGDAIVSAARAAGVEVLVVVISGVWNWLSDGEPIPDMVEIPVEGRRVTVCFDSDMLRNPHVQQANDRLAKHLEDRGAIVFITYLHDQPNGSKTGADDFFAAGGTFAELRLLTRRYDPADFARIRLSRDEKLRAFVEDLERRLWDTPWKGQGGHTDRDVYLKLVEAAERHGKAGDDGVRVTISHGTLQLAAAIGSPRTLCKSLNRLEEAGLIYRDNEDRKPDKAGSFVLRASVKYNEKREGQEGKVTPQLHSTYPRTLHLRAPRLRWSRPKWKPSRRMVREYRLGTRSRLPEPRDRIERLGKTRGAIIDALYVAGGSTTLDKLTASLHKKRPRDLRRLLLPMLEEAGIVTVCGDVVSLTDDWLERLEGERERGLEIDTMGVDGVVVGAETIARRRLKLKREAFHNRRETKPDRAPTVEELEARRPAFEAALEARKHARQNRMREAALEAFRTPGSDAFIWLKLIREGQRTDRDPLVWCVMDYHQRPDKDFEEWREPVLAAAAIIAREHAPSAEDAPPADDWMTHDLECECAACTSPAPKYAKAWGAA